jgi:hypothetical protein
MSTPILPRTIHVSQGIGLENSVGFEYVRLTIDGVNEDTKQSETVFAVIPKAMFFDLSNKMHKLAVESHAYQANLLTDAQAASMQKEIHHIESVVGGPIHEQVIGLVLMTKDQKPLILSMAKSLAVAIRQLLPES